MRGDPLPLTELNLRDEANREDEHPSHDAFLRRSIPEICSEWFPENEHNTWNVEDIAHVRDRAFVLVRPEPNDVGYDRFVVLFGYTSPVSDFSAHAIYAQVQDSKFELHSTAQDCPEDIPTHVVW
jgi:hypothetical protein